MTAHYLRVASLRCPSVLAWHGGGNNGLSRARAGASLVYREFCAFVAPRIWPRDKARAEAMAALGPRRATPDRCRRLTENDANHPAHHARPGHARHGEAGPC